MHKYMVTVNFNGNDTLAPFVKRSIVWAYSMTKAHDSVAAEYYNRYSRNDITVKIKKMV